MEHRQCQLAADTEEKKGTTTTKAIRIFHSQYDVVLLLCLSLILHQSS